MLDVAERLEPASRLLKIAPQRGHEVHSLVPCLILGERVGTRLVFAFSEMLQVFTCISDICDAQSSR